MPIPHFRYSFAKGFDKMTLEDIRKAKAELYDFLGCTTKSDFSRKKHSFRDIPQHVYDGVNQIFLKYGVQEEDIWIISEIR
ncbi:hypothetical protein [Bacteroides sp. 41_26]|uniref:hypothetical protein n=1 Tax=Bacteroides sp. 41_26 TaxID=1896973 RepID=UPI00259D180F|nr:hypothetical protein [Bacteroides sp. 41_26]